MHYMNSVEVENNVTKFRNHPVLGEAAKCLKAFMDEVNAHSDGWAYWRPPVQAAHSLMLILEEGRADVTYKTYVRTLQPIKAFMTRKGDAAGMRRIFFLSDGRMILAHKSTFPDRDRPLVEDHYPKAVKPESKPAAVKWDRLSDGNNLVTALQLIRELCGCTEMNMDDMEQTTLDSLFRAQAFIFHAESHGVKF